MNMGGYDPMAMARSMTRDEEDPEDMDFLNALGSTTQEMPAYESPAEEETQEDQSSQGFGAGITPLSSLAVAAPYATSREVKQVTAKEEGKPAQTVRNETARVERPAVARDLERMAIAEGEKYKLDPSLIRHVMAKETGNLADKANAVSKAGALGVMQLMPGTAKDMGVRDPFDPVQNIEGGVKYLAKMQRKYDDPKLAAIAYNWGPGNTDRWLAQGGDMNRLPKETRNYIAGLAQGGSVQHYANQGQVESDDGGSVLDTIFPPLEGGKPNPLAQALKFKRYVPDEGTVFDPETGNTYNIERGAQATPGTTPYTDEGIRLLQNHPNKIGGGRGVVPADKYSIEQEQAGKVVQPTPSEQSPTAEVLHMMDLHPPTGKISTDATDEGPVAPAGIASQIPASDDLKDYFAKGIAALQDQKKINAYLALISGGLGAAGGTSQYAAANIGQGGQKGVEAYMAGNKDITAQQNALLQGRLGLEKYQSLRDIQAQQMKNLQEYRDDKIAAQNAERDRRIAAGKETATLAEQRLAETHMKNLDEVLARKEKEAIALALAQEKNAFTPEQHAQIQAKAIADLHKRPDYQQPYKERYGELPMGAQPQATLSQADSDLVNKYLKKP